MNSLLNNAKTALRNFNNDENGMETMQVVMILAIAAIAGVSIYAIGGKLVDWANDKTKTMTDKEDFKTVE